MASAVWGTLKVLKHALWISTVVEHEVRALQGLTEWHLEGEIWLSLAVPPKPPLLVEMLSEAGRGQLLFPCSSSCLVFHFPLLMPAWSCFVSAAEEWAVVLSRSAQEHPEGGRGQRWVWNRAGAGGIVFFWRNPPETCHDWDSAEPSAANLTRAQTGIR